MVFCLFASEQESAQFLRIAFEQSRVVLSGTVPSEADVERITSMILEARPDLQVDHQDLTISPQSPNLDTKNFQSLLTEISLSTFEGRLIISPTRLEIGGMTDSILARSVLRLRAKPFLKERSLIDRICIVSSDELPLINVALATGQSVPAVAGRSVTDTAAPRSTPEVPFEPPGIRLESLLATLNLLGQIDHLAGRTAPPAASLRAIPLEVTESLPAPPATDSVAAPSDSQSPVLPRPTGESVSSVYFARNSFFLQVNQEEVFHELAKRVLAQGQSGVSVEIQTLIPATGSSVLNEYLTERRSEEVLKFLGEHGIPSERVLTHTLPSSSNFDTGEVRISLITPTPVPIASPNPDSQTTEISAQSVPSSSAEVTQ